MTSDISIENSNISDDNDVNLKKEVKLPYFHRVLSADDQQLVGDCKPKAIDSTTHRETSSAAAGGSVWNSANTWEEKNCSKAAYGILEKILVDDTDYVNNSKGYAIKILFCTTITGHANITFIRGTPRLLYDLSASEMKGEVIMSNDAASTHSFTVEVSDMINDQDSDDIVIKYSSDTTALPSYISKNGVVTDIQKFIKSKLATFERELRDKCINKN